MTSPSSSPVSSPGLTSSNESDANATEAERSGGNDAVCFTAGIKGAAFQAGVIHSYLASDRKAPAIAAGISIGALSAAALQRCYRELDEEAQQQDRETARWSWYRRFLRAVSEQPLNVIWKSFPNPDDISSPRPPVQDLSCDEMSTEEAKARERFYLLSKLGSWISRLPISVRRVATLAVSYVRAKEGYWGWKGFRWIPFGWNAILVTLLGSFHLAAAPEWLDRKTLGLRFWRPLFGWPAWLGSWLLTGTLITVVSAALIVLLGLSGLMALGLDNTVRESNSWWQVWKQSDFEPVILPKTFILAFAIVLTAAAMAVVAVKGKKARKGAFRIFNRALAHLGGKLEIREGWLDDYHLHRRLRELFADDCRDPKVGSKPFPVLLVAACLEELDPSIGNELVNQQIWPREGASLVRSLRAALALPLVFDPIKLSHPCDIGKWVDLSRLKEDTQPERLTLVDGSVIRKNPIPALFSYLRRTKHGEVAQKLSDPEGKRPAGIHIVYGVPVQARTVGAAERLDSLDIVDSARISAQLAARRDTKMERRQTNFISLLRQLSNQDQHGAGNKGSTPLFPIFAEDIAPEREIEFKNPLSPTRKESLKAAAAGCKRSLETLYAGELRKQQRFWEKEVPCSRFLLKVSPDRTPFITRDTPGLREVCSHCQKTLKPPVVVAHPNRPPGMMRSYGLAEEESQVKDVDLSKEFPQLTGTKPRIVFVASGGVFRGATHVGVLAALREAGIKPDLIVGASVGTLMGAALGAMCTAPDNKSAQSVRHQVLAELALAFLQVDIKVALTESFKQAIRRLGDAARRVGISPRDLRRIIRKGASADPSFAATGAPAVLIDAFADLFLLPHRATSRIAAEFVAGHFADATQLFLSHVKKDTLRRLGVRHSMMGTSLLQPLAEKLLGKKVPSVDLADAQPYKSSKIAFFATTTNLARRHSLILGRDFFHATKSYDFVEAALSSSAFPVVFSPRRESDVLPGIGCADELFADGGMFDNLPFFPSIEVLAAVQAHYRFHSELDPIESLAGRVENPDLLIAAALDASPDSATATGFDTQRKIWARANRLKKNLKIDSFDWASSKVHELMKDLSEQPPESKSDNDEDFVPVIDKAVSAGVLSIEPLDDEHINPTFAFSKTTGFKRERMARAIAHGCFQTFRKLASAQNGEDGLTQAARASVRILSDKTSGRIFRLEVADERDRESSGENKCPFFRHDDGGSKKTTEFVCPFVAAGKTREGEDADLIVGVHRACCADSTHLDLSR